MPRYFVRTLVIPLSLAALISLAIGVFVPWQGLFVNLATSFFSVLITVIYVDRVLQEHERRVWKRVSGLIRERVIRFGYTTVLEIRVALGLEYGLFGKSFFNTPVTDEKINSELIRYIEEVINPFVLERLNEMDNKEWKGLADTLERIVKQGDSLIDLYGSKLAPELLQVILDVQTQVSKILSQYYIIPDLLGVPESHLKSKSPDVAWHFMNLTIQSTGSAIREINRLAVILIKLS
jgi:hypothetical protein